MERPIAVANRSGVSSAKPRKRRTKVRPFSAFEYAMLMAVVLVATVPLAWTALTSLKPEDQIFLYPPTILPSSFTLDNFRHLFVQTHFATYLLNSSYVSSATTLMTIVLGTIGAYSFARFQTKHRYLRLLGQLSLVAYMLPAILLVVPIALLVYDFGLGANLSALVFVYTATSLPFALWILRSYFFGVSVELEEAAMVDGCTRFGAFIRVVIPQAVPGIIATAIFVFNGIWQEYLFASILLQGDPNSLTLSIGLSHFINPSGDVFEWGVLMAASVVMTVPVIVLFTLAQKQLVGGATLGAIKG